VAEILFLTWQPFIWAAVADSQQKQKGRLTIVYGPERTVILLDPALVNAKERFLRAACGDGTAQYMAGYEYENGLGLERNPMQAYFWYSIADLNGRTGAAEQRNNVATKLTPEQLAEAQRLVQQWKKPSECDESIPEPRHDFPQAK
jgi:TPR repeat protein